MVDAVCLRGPLCCALSVDVSRPMPLLQVRLEPKQLKEAAAVAAGTIYLSL